jgi:NADPH-dependent 2,4-dienoyl-CoA reductase/sulfur reductase-like enzyme/peroxiredoxin family protein/TusA-related sulfurtransferase/rhodanese-related sulfurtransferase
MKTLIIGGVAGGATAAARLRRRDEHMEILILDKGEYISYANCGLPYHIGDVIEDRDALLLQSPQTMKAKLNVDVRLHSEVTEILPEEKAVRVKNAETGETYTESYDNLIIATGSSPVTPPIPGIEADNIFTLWTIPQMDKIKKYTKEQNPRNAVVVGGGFIGLEIAENLSELGISVTVVEMQRQVMAPLDYEMANLVHENMIMNNVNLLLGTGVSEFVHDGQDTTVVLSDGRSLQADMVIMSAGIRPNSGFAKSSGIELNARGGIVVDNKFRTSLENVYAIGDVIETDHFITGERTMIPLAGPANRQARILADIITGADSSYRGTMGTSVAKIYDYTVAATGLNEKQLQTAGLVKECDYYVALINQKSHAGYYPGATNMTLKMIFSPDGKIFGGQIVGQEGVDKRIDTLAATIRNGGDIYMLQELELAYAPPYSSAKDPVNMLGYVAENILTGMVKFTEAHELDAELAAQEDNGITVLDVSEDMERMVFSIPGSVHIPQGQLRDRIGELNRSKHIIVYCTIGIRSYNSARVLMQNGFDNVSVLAGGTSFYKSMHYEERLGGSLAEGFGEAPESHEGVEDLETTDREIRVLNCCGMQCPGPIMSVNEQLNQMEEGEILKVRATDMGFAADVEAWCRRTGNTLIKKEREGNENIVYIRKGTGELSKSTGSVARQNDDAQGKTIIVFSGNLDKVLASFIIANGSAAMGRPVTMFFTFWGLNALRKAKSPAVKKTFIEKMFGMMMPKGTDKLKLSNMNMGGMGSAMMKKVMKDKNVDSLEQLMKMAMANGVKLVACTMSMDVMGIKEEELIDGVELAGVASYLGDAEESNVNLFV